MTFAKMLDSEGGRVFTPLMPETTKQRLLRVLCPDVDERVAAMLDSGMSWRDIADSIASAAAVNVSHESLRQWYGKDSAA